MEDKELIQLMHEGYHSPRTIAEWANLPVSEVVAIYNAHLADLADDELEAKGYHKRGN